MKGNRWALAGIAVGLVVVFGVVGYCTYAPPEVDTSAADHQAARFDSLAASWADAHAAAMTRADSLADVVAQRDTALQQANVRASQWEAQHDEARKTVRRLTEQATGVGGAKGEFDLAAFTASQQALTVQDSLVAGLREQVRLQQEQIETLKAQNALLRASLAQSDSLVVEAKKTVEVSNAALSAVEDALRRERRRSGLWKGLTFAASGAEVVAAGGFAICAAVTC